MRACRPMCCLRRCMSDSARAARRISPTRYSPPCVTNLAGIWRNQPGELHEMNNVDLDQLAINTIRTLSIDAIQQANSGHPGAPMALAPLVYTIWNRVM